MLLPIMTHTAMLWLRKNKTNPDVLKLYQNGENICCYLQKVLKQEPIVFQEFSEVTELPTLIVSEKNRGFYATKNAETLYSALISLNDSVATDTRLWAGLSHTVYYDFIRQSLSITYKNNPENIYTAENNTIERYFLFNEDDKRSLFMYNNTIPRFWHIGHNFYRSNKTNPFDYLTIASRDINPHVSRLFTVKLFQNEHIMNAFMEFERQYLENTNSNSLNRELFNEQVKYLQRLSGTYALDIIPEKKLIAKLMEHAVAFSHENVNKTDVEEVLIAAFNKCGGIIPYDKIQVVYDEFPQFKKELSALIMREIEQAKPKCLNLLKKKNVSYLVLQLQHANDQTRNNIKKLRIDVLNGLEGDAKKLQTILAKYPKKTFTKKELLPYSAQLMSSCKFDIETSFDNAMAELINIGLYQKHEDKFIQLISTV